MWSDDRFVQFNSKFSQSNPLNEIISISDTLASHPTKKKKNVQHSFQPIPIPKDDLSKKQQVTRSIDILEQSLIDMNIYETRIMSFCGLWEDYPRHRYRMRFCIEMGQLVGYSNTNDRKAFASYDGRLINMIIVHPKESGRTLNHYRGCLGWNQQYIKWEKEDFSCESGWRSTRRWIKID